MCTVVGEMLLITHLHTNEWQWLLEAERAKCLRCEGILGLCINFPLVTTFFAVKPREVVLSLRSSSVFFNCWEPSLILFAVANEQNFRRHNMSRMLSNTGLRVSKGFYVTCQRLFRRLTCFIRCTTPLSLFQKPSVDCWGRRINFISSSSSGRCSF